MIDDLRARRPHALLQLLAGLFVAAGGVIHLREWADVYRFVPAAIPGSAVVRIGFPVQAGLSLLAALALAVTAFRLRRFRPAVVGATLAFQLGSLAALVASRNGSLFGWSEPGWTVAARQTAAVEGGAVIALVATMAVAGLLTWRSSPRLQPVPARVRRG